VIVWIFIISPFPLIFSVQLFTPTYCFVLTSKSRTNYQRMSTDQQISQLQSLVNELMVKISNLENNAHAQVDIQQDLKAQVYSANSVDTGLNSGDTAWMLAATALVLFMTIPGLTLFYAGMARSKNVLAIVMQCFVITALITFLWLSFGYSLTFAPAQSDVKSAMIYGDASRFWLQGMGLDTTHQLAPTIPESLFCVYQLTFAIITPALITGAFADRMKFEAMIPFMALWHFIVYCPTAHSLWHPDGFLYKAEALDYAGGNVVHISAGFSGLVSSLYLGVRSGHGEDNFEPHNILLTAVGAAMLWVGWFGFNAGSALGATDRAAFAMLNTQISSSISALSWMAAEWYVRKRPSILGTVCGAVSGMVCITPAAGFVDQTGAFITGLLAGPLCYLGSQAKHALGYDDALDAFGVHGVGGVLGAFLVGFFANPNISGGPAGVFYANTEIGGHQLGMQIYSIVVTVAWSVFATYMILLFVDYTIGVRVPEAYEIAGLDAMIHGESVHGGGGSRGGHPGQGDRPKRSIEITVRSDTGEVIRGDTAAQSSAAGSDTASNV
jgi:Amt family ammonium transporter